MKGASPLGSNWVEEFVGSKFNVCVVPACDRHGADVVHVEVRPDNLEGSLQAPGAVAVLEDQSM